MKMTFKEIAARFLVKERVVRDLMYKLRKKPIYFIKEAEKTALRNKQETATFAVIQNILDAKGSISSVKQL